jgi:hypothetical protein
MHCRDGQPIYHPDLFVVQRTDDGRFLGYQGMWTERMTFARIVPFVELPLPYQHCPEVEVIEADEAWIRRHWGNLQAGRPLAPLPQEKVHKRVQTRAVSVEMPRCLACQPMFKV